MLNTERSEVFESHEVVIERQQALEYIFKPPFGRFKNSSTALQCSRRHHMLNTERSEVLEPHKMGIERQ